MGRKTSNGIQISGQAKHFIQRIIGTGADPIKTDATGKPVRRSGVEFDAIADALFNVAVRPVKTNPTTKKRSLKFYNDACEVAVNPDTGTLIQCNPRGE